MILFIAVGQLPGPGFQSTGSTTPHQNERELFMLYLVYFCCGFQSYRFIKNYCGSRAEAKFTDESSSVRNQIKRPRVVLGLRRVKLNIAVDYYKLG